MVESNAALSATAIHTKPARREARGFFDGGPEGEPVRAAAEGNQPMVKPQGNLVQVLGPEVRPKEN